MATTTNGFPYPAGTDPADVPYWMQQLAQKSDDMTAGTGAFTTAWTAFTPTIVGTAAPTVDARYKQIGKTVFFRIEIVLTAAVTAAMTATLPVAPRTAAGTGPSYGAIYAKDTSAGLYINGQAISSATGGGSTFRIMLAASGTNSNLADASASAPFVWASGDTISIRGEYEAA